MSKVLGLLAVALALWGCVTQSAELEQGRWQQVENKPNCAVWNEHLPPNSTATWTGDCVGGWADGDGREVWRYLAHGNWVESNYTGEMKGGRKHGRGVLVGADGSKYEGDWKDGKVHGRGIYLWADGERYQGTWKDGKPHGSGTYRRKDGVSLSGTWTNGCFKRGEFEAWIGTSKEACGRLHLSSQNGQVRVVRHEYPDDAFQITSDFRSRYNTIGQKRKAPHSGIDIPAPEGTPVLAIADGVVYRSRLHKKNGEEIKIKHAYRTQDEIRAQYIHLGVRLVEVGDEVRRGQIIGTVGTTGAPEMLTSGVSHLHMALWSTSRRGNGGHCCKNENPHEFWYSGRDSITLFQPGRTYSDFPHLFTYPIPGKNDLNHFHKRLAGLTQ